MKAFLEPFKQLEDYNSIVKSLKNSKLPLYLTGCIDSQKCHLFYSIGSDYQNKVIITYNEIKAKEIYEDLKFFDSNVYLYPAKDVIFFNADIQSNTITGQRLEIIKKIIENEPITVVMTIDACMDHVIDLRHIKEHVIHLGVGQEILLQQTQEQLIWMGYERVGQVEQKGQFSIRGGIIDIYPLTDETAYRIELWDDEIDSIRMLNVSTQRSIDKIDQIQIFPAAELILSHERIQAGIIKIDKDKEETVKKLKERGDIDAANHVKSMVAELKERLTAYQDFSGLFGYIHYFYQETTSLIHYFDEKNTVFFMDEPVRLVEKISAVHNEFRESMIGRLEKGYVLPSQMNLIYDAHDIVYQLSQKRLLVVSTLVQSVKQFQIGETFNLSVKSINPYNNSFELLIKDLKFFKERKYKIVLLAGSRTRAERLAKDIQDNGLNAYYSKDFDRFVNPGEILVGYGNLHRGFEYPLINLVIISEGDVFGKDKRVKKKKKKYEGKKIQNFSELNVGDYVVHENHGLGVYQGIDKMEVDNVSKDYIKIAYRDGGNLYIPTNQLNLIQKYIGGEVRKPKLNKLGTAEWGKTKTRVKGAVQDLAKTLVELYAKRQEESGYIYSADSVWQMEFEEMFPYDETQDQIIAIEDVKSDMESKKIMDRLVCGDVGYGKTEVAIRAAFKAVQDGKQVAYLVPTTILAQQHYNNFVQRMKDFPVRVDMLSRFRSAKEQKKTTEDLRKGMVDIVVGTHRLLSKDLQFKDLGLLIVDEEQRFGVGHKEKIKQMKGNVDVLTLTATPIPRTLHMSLIGIRDMSVLEEPPEERQPIQTYVLEFNEEMVREAINRELAREGQVYYVYNRVNNIEDISSMIQRLVPDANVAFAHGQMKETELEQIMFDFINGDIDVLVSTTIIETGLDISNVNTMIIHDADQLGLSQLYQLRGRVGRSNRMAYAYLLYKRNKVLKETAEKRLQAIREFTELGAGFKIAMRDLEIRGAGNLLGAQQHGHMEAVGYDLYCKMLNEAVSAVKNDDYEENFETSIDLDVDAFIPPIYIKNEIQKLDVYKRIATIENEEDFVDMQEELIDRFGDMPNSVDNLLEIALIKAIAHSAEVVAVEQKKEKVRFIMRNNAKVDPSKIPQLLEKSDKKLTFSVQEAPFFVLELKKTNRSEIFRQIKIALQDIKSLKI